MMKAGRVRTLVSFLVLCSLLFGGSALAKYETLEKGDSGAEVLNMQSALASLGYDLTTDGIFGAGTEKVVMQFQKEQKLTSDGQAGDKTLTRLYLLAPSFKPDAASISASAVVSAAGTKARVQTTGGTLTLRQTQSTGAKALQYIPNLTVLTVSEKGSTWCKTTYNGKTGYVLTSYLNFNYDNNNYTATPSPTPTAKIDSTITARVQTTGGTLTLRQSQSTGAKALQYIPNLTILSVSEKGSKWCKATYNGQTGYVLTSYLNFDIQTQTASARVQTTGGTLTLRQTQSTGAKALRYIPNLTVLSVSEKGSTWCKTTYDGQTGYVLTSYLNFNYNNTNYTATPSPTPTATPDNSGSATAAVKTTGGTLTLRKSQSTGSAALKYIPNQTVLTISEKGSKWCKTTYDGKTGYVLTSYLVFSDAKVVTATPTASPTPTPDNSPDGLTATVKTTGGTLTLRKTASTSAAALRLIPNKTVLTVQSVGEKWCTVTYGGQTGYVLTSYLVFGEEDASTPTPSPTPTATPSYDTDTLSRTLTSGMTGSDVRLVQERLRELNYVSSVTGTYDAQTVAAVKQFQKLHGLTEDGKAGKNTFTVLFSDAAIAYSDDLNSYETLHIYYDDYAPDAAAVSRMQTALRELDYTVSVNGKFDETTYLAVLNFQMRNGLTTDGVAGASTQALLYSGHAKGMPATPCLTLSDSDGYMNGPSDSQVQLLHWYNVVKPALASGSSLLIYDPDTGLSWTLKVYARGRHADCQPATLKDTLLMFKSFGKIGWTVQTVYVRLPDGRWTMATMHDRPHLTGSITNNGFDGHLCVHFLRDMDECRQNDPNYGVQNQTTLRNAWKALTGETVD